MTLPAGFKLDEEPALPDGFEIDSQQKEKSALETIGGGLEAAGTVLSSIAAEPIAGLAGLATALNPFQPEGAGGARVRQVREMLTYKPKLAGAQAALETVADVVKPVAEKLGETEKTLGDYVLEKTGSEELAAIAHTLPTATLEMLGLGAFKRGKSVKAIEDVAQAKVAAQKAVDAAEETTGIRQLTTDVFEPKSRTGKFFQQQGEVVAGGLRADQQAQRTRAVEKLLGKYDVTDAARYERDIVQGVKNSVDKTKAGMAKLYEDSTAKLNSYGEVGLAKTKDFARKAIDAESVKGSLADKSLIDDMTAYLEAPEGLDFETIKSIRTSVGNKLKLAKQGAPIQGNTDTGNLKMLYKSLSEDMESFAKAADPELAKKWKAADKEFSGFATGSNKQGIRRLVKNGDATPEDVDTLLFSNKKSDVDFLANNIDENGRLALKQRVLQRALQKSSLSGDDINPNKFQAQLNKLRVQVQSVFDKDEVKALDELTKALAQTRRAQDAAVATASGQSVVPMLAFLNPLVLTPGVVQRALETKTIRNMLIRRAAAKSAEARNAIDTAIANEISGLTATALAAPGVISGSEDQ